MTSKDPAQLAQDESEGPRPSCLDLFLGFGMVGLLGFGGVMPWVRWLLVDRTRWYKESEFADVFSVSNVIPGGNVIAISVMAGAQMQGVRGALAALGGLTIGPAMLVCLLGSLYLEYRHLPVVQSTMAAMAAAGAGLILGTGLRLLRPLLRSKPALAVLVAVFATVMIWHLPLWQVLLIFTPISLYLMRRWGPK